MPSTTKQYDGRTPGRTFIERFTSRVLSPFLTKNKRTSRCKPHEIQGEHRIAAMMSPHTHHRTRLHGRRFINKLPNELLSHVFILGAQDDSMLPMAVSHVCRFWRDLALSTPSLWRRISLGPGKTMWTERIRRAKACSLDVELLPWLRTASRLIEPQLLDFYTVQWYMHLATPYISRWRSLEIIFAAHSPFLWNASLSGCCSSNVAAPLLEQLSLVYRANEDTKEFCLFSGFAPRLRRVTLDGVRLTWLPSLFQNITYLDYTHHGFTRGGEAVHDVLSMLEVTVHLVVLRILFPRKPGPPARIRGPFRPPRRVSLPALTHLSLRTETEGIPLELQRLVSLISTPSLSALRLIDLGRRNYPLSNLDAIMHSYTFPASLMFVYIEYGWYRPHDVEQLFRMLPNLRRLVARRSHVPDQVYIAR